MNILVLLLMPFATFMGWEIVKAVTPVAIPDRLPPLIVSLIALLLMVMPHKIILALTAAFTVILLHKMIDVPPTAPLRIPWGKFRRKRQEDTIVLPPGVGRRIPDI